MRTSILLVPLLGWGCASDLTGGLPPGDAQLAILHAGEPGAGVELALDGGIVRMPMPGGRGSMPITAGRHTLALREESGRILAATRFTAPEGMRVTVVVQQLGGGEWSLQVGPDHGALPPAGGASIRIIQSAALEVPLAAWLGRDAAGDGSLQSEFRITATAIIRAGANDPLPDFMAVVPGSYHLILLHPGDAEEEAVRLPVPLERGSVVTVVVAPGTDGGPLVWIIREA